MQSPPRASLDIEGAGRRSRYSTTSGMGLPAFPDAHAVRSLMCSRRSVLSRMNAAAVWKLFALASYHATTLICIPDAWHCASLLLAAALWLRNSTRRQTDGDFFALHHRLRLAGHPSDARAAMFNISGVAAGRRPRKVEALRLRLAAALYRHIDCRERRGAFRAHPGRADESTRALGIVQLVVGGARRRLNHSCSCRWHAG